MLAKQATSRGFWAQETNEVPWKKRGVDSRKKPGLLLKGFRVWELRLQGKGFRV